MHLLSVVVVILLLALGGGPAAAQQLIGPRPLPPAPGAPEVIPGQFIVELKAGVDRDAVINAHGLAAIFRYAIINGFAARMSDAAAARLAADPRVQAVSPDLVVHAFPKPSGGPGRGAAGIAATADAQTHRPPS